MTRNQHIDKFGLKYSTTASVWMIAALTLAILPFMKPTIISPLADNPIVSVQAAEPEPTELEKITDYIVHKFQPEGRAVAVRALACFISESGLRPDAYNFNTNGTDDVGIPQINSVHGMSTEDRRDYKKSIDKAYQIYKQSHSFRDWYGPGCH